MKKNFFKLMLLGAFALTLGFVGCNKYDKEIEDLCKQVSLLEGEMAEIKGQLQDGFVKSVTQKPGADNVLVVTYSNRPTPTELTIPTGGGTGSTITKEDGFWVFNGESTGIPVAGIYPPKLNTTTGYWQFADEDGDYTDSKYYAGPWATIDDDDVITLYVQDKTGAMQAIPLAKNANGLPAGIASIEILGWMTDFTTKLTNGISLSTEVYGKTPAEALSGTAGDPVVVKYSFVDHFELDSDVGGATSILTPAPATYTWPGGSEIVKKGTATNTLAADQTGLLVQVYPANADVSEVEFAVANALGEVLPVVWTAKKVENTILTRATGDSALWFIQGGFDDTDYGTQLAYINMFKNNAVYSLVYSEDDGRSSYSEFTFQSAPVGSTEQAVKNLKTGTTASADGNFTVYPGKAYIAEFNAGTITGMPKVDVTPATVVAAPTATSNAVVDYYFEVSDFDQKLFGVVLSDNNKAFTVTYMPDVVSLADFTITIWKLGVDGKVFKENLTIDPQREQKDSTIPYSWQEDDNNDGEEGTDEYMITDAKVTGESVSGPMTFKLDQMFADLATIHFSGTQGQSNYLTMADYYKNAARGAKTQTITGVTVDGVAMTAAELATFITNVSGDNDPKVFQGYNAAGVATDNLNEAVKLVVTPRFNTVGDPATRTPATAVFQIGKEYEVTFEVKDQGGQHINNVTLTFTPVIPSPEDSLFKKQEIFWDVETKTILEAYYKDPATWAAGEAPNKEKYDVAPGTDGAVPPVPYGDGGFESFVDGVTWEIVAPTTINTVAINTLVTYTQTTGAATPSQDMIFELVNQYGRTIAAVNEVTDNIDYNVNGKLETSVTVPYDVVAQLSAEAIAAGRTTPSATALLAAAAQANAYGTVLTVAPTAAYNYLGSYAYTADDRAKMGFKIKIMSALYEGSIKPTNGDSIPLTPSYSGKPEDATARLDDAHLIGTTYATGVNYSLFQIWDGTKAVYQYTYIDKVEFYVPMADINKYYIVKADGTGTNTAIAPAAAGETGYVLIKPNNTTGADVNAGIIVRVYDRFGKVKQTTVPITIRAAVPAAE